jgi:DMSO/TMAO reductase YedYZ molybdopterin-dependent catalytic subunit
MMHRVARTLPPGVLAAGPALLALLVGSLVLGGPGILEAIVDGLVRTVPLPVFESVLGALGPLAKGITFLLVVAGAMVAGGLLGVAVRRLAGPPTPGGAAGRAVLAAGLALALAELVVLPLAGAGFLGLEYGGSAVALQVPLVVACVLYGVTFALVERPAAAPGDASTASAAEIRGTFADAPGTSDAPGASPGAGLPRRTVLAGGLAVAALGVSGIVAAARVTTAAATGRAPARRAASAGGFGPTPAVTPIEDHYVVAKGLVPPSVDGATWRLAVDGQVARPLELSLQDLMALGATSEARTLICISNPVVTYGQYAGTQVWTGAPVAVVLELAGGPLANARHVLWTSADAYTESIPLDVALDPRSLLAWGMGPDGAPLPVEHGFPVRVLLPGRYGMKQPKWLTRMTLAAEDVDGFWEQQGWDREAVVRTWSRIDDPRDGDDVAAGQPLPVYGVAFAGERGIRGVEISADGGSSWAAAELEAPASPLAWVRWRATLPAPPAGPVVLRVRATDGTGALQPEVPEPPLPRGAAGWHQVRIIAG